MKPNPDQPSPPAYGPPTLGAGATKPRRPKWLVAGLVLVLAVMTAVTHGFLLRGPNNQLDDIAARLGMDCITTEIEAGQQLIGIELASVIADPVFSCAWEDNDYEVITWRDWLTLSATLVDKLPEVVNLNPDKLLDACQGLIFSANIDNLVANSLVLTDNHAFASYEQAADLRRAMEIEGISLQPLPSACDEFLSQANR